MLSPGHLLSCTVRNPETVTQVANCMFVVGRVPDCAERKKKPDTDLSAFFATPNVTPEADLLTYGTTSPLLAASGASLGSDKDSRRRLGWVILC
jgi:hypothetical protein